MSEEGVTVPDIFRRPGNTSEQKKLIKKLAEGRSVNFSDYNFYTLASVIKVTLNGCLISHYARGNLPPSPPRTPRFVIHDRLRPAYHPISRYTID